MVAVSMAGSRGKPVIPWDVRWVPVADLRVDEAYQRAKEPAIVARLAARFNVDIAGPLRVSERDDGSLWVVDGQHRLDALRALGYEVAYCYVERGRQRVEARGYVKLNAGTKVKALRRFKATLIAADDPAIVAVDALISASGFVIAYDRNTDGPESFRAVSTALRIYRVRATDGAQGRERLARVLSLARETWPDTPGGGQSVILKALDSLLTTARGAALNRARFVRVVGAAINPGEVAITAHQRSRAHGYSAEQWALNDMIEAYNKKLQDPARRLLKPIPTYAAHDEAVDEVAGDDTLFDGASGALFGTDTTMNHDERRAIL